MLEQKVHSAKRKRSSNGRKSEVNGPDLEAKLRQKLHHAIRELRKVVKKARTFEVQKTLKRLKDARRKDPESDIAKHLAVQMEILKHLKYDELAHSALMTKLKKDKTLCTNPTIQTISVQLASNTIALNAPGTPAAKVQSRILSSKVLASEVSSIVESLRLILHTPVESEGIGDLVDNSRTLPNTSKKRRTGIGPEKDAFTPEDGVSEPSGEGVNENASGDEVAAEVSGDGWESGTVGVPSESDDFMVAVADGHGSTSQDGSGDDFPSEDARRKKSHPHGSKGQSEFLPSLKVNFTQGDSCSEFSDDELKLVDGIKRNRRGQRARRAIWEKKFGKNANHLKSTEHHQPGPVPVDRRFGKGNSSSRRRRTPTESGAPGYGHEKDHRLNLKRSEGVKRSGPGVYSCQSNLKGESGEQPLHPSWEAKRTQKTASIVPSQGTKIVFSDP